MAGAKAATQACRNIKLSLNVAVTLWMTFPMLTKTERKQQEMITHGDDGDDYEAEHFRDR